MSDKYKPQAFEHPVSGAQRTATSVAQEVALKYDGFRPVETKKSTPKADDSTTPKSTSKPSETSK